MHQTNTLPVNKQSPSLFPHRTMMPCGGSIPLTWSPCYSWWPATAHGLPQPHRSDRDLLGSFMRSLLPFSLAFILLCDARGLLRFEDPSAPGLSGVLNSVAVRGGRHVSMLECKVLLSLGKSLISRGGCMAAVDMNCKIAKGACVGMGGKPLGRAGWYANLIHGCGSILRFLDEPWSESKCGIYNVRDTFSPDPISCRFGESGPISLVLK